MNISPKANSLSGLRPQTFGCKAFYRSSSVEDDSYESSSDEDSVSVHYSDNESQWLRWTRAEPWSLSTSLHLHSMLYSVAGLLSILSLSISVQGTIPTLSYSFTLDAEPLRRSCLLLHPYAFQQRILKVHSMSSCPLLGRTGKTLVVCALAEEAGFWMLAIRCYGHCGFFIYKAVFSN